MQLSLTSAFGYAQGGGGLGVTEAINAHQDEDVTCPVGQRGDGPLQIERRSAARGIR